MSLKSYCCAFSHHQCIQNMRNNVSEIGINMEHNGKKERPRFTAFTIHNKPKTISFVGKTYHIQYLLSEGDIWNDCYDKTYTVTTFSKEERVENHKSLVSTFGLWRWLWITVWIPELHKNPYNERFIAGYAKRTTKLLSIYILLYSQLKKSAFLCEQIVLP